MLTAHQVLAVAAVAVSALAAVWAGVAYLRGAWAGRLLTHALALAQTVLVAQVAVGLLMLSDDRRAGDDLHYLYGTLALTAVLAPWLYAPAAPRRRLAWFGAATLVAGALAVRAYMTA